MGKQVKELIANPLKKRNDDPNCVICHPRPDKISHDKAWRFSLETKQQPFKEGTHV